MLQKGDILYIQKGYTVFCDEIPAVFYKGTHPYSEKIGSGIVTIGVPKEDKTDLKALREEIKDLIKFAFAYKKAPLDNSILDRFVAHQVPDIKRPDFLIPAGKYIVVRLRQASTITNAHLQSYDTDLPLRKFSIDALALEKSDRGLLKLLGQDLGYVER